MNHCRTLCLLQKLPLVKQQPSVILRATYRTLCHDKTRSNSTLKCCHSKYFLVRNKSTGVSVEANEDGFVKKFLQRLRWFDHSKSILKVSGYMLYESVADQVQYQTFFKEFNLADTFFSWFIVTEIHVWMLMVRVMNEGDDGRFTRNIIVEAMWQDVGTRAKKLGAANPSSVREQVQDLSQQFQAALIGYDEGILSDDKVLTGAIWRRFFQRNCEHPESVERLVHYVRKQIYLLDQQPRSDILDKPIITWIDINRDVSMN